MISKKLYEYTQFRGKREYKGLYGKKAAVRVEEEDNIRVMEAKEQFDLESVSVEDVIRHSLTFLQMIGIKTKGIILQVQDTCKGKEKIDIDYDGIKEEFGLNYRNHIVWMKFTESGHLGVVAASDDINFSNSNSSGRLVSEVGTKWDESFVLVFPLPQISDGLRKDIECGIGNYLTSMGVPIIDYYSHRFQ